MRKPTTIICLAMILALVMSSVAMAAPGYIIGGYRYLSSDVASNPDMMLELNGALADGLSNLIVDLDGTPFNYSNFIAAGGADYEGGFQAFSAANPETIPAGTLIKNPDGTTTPDPAAEAGDTVTVTAITAQTVAVAATVDVAVTADPATAAIAATSSDEAVATVAVNGSTITVTGVAAGTATITVNATADGYTAGSTTFDVTVNSLPTAAITAIAAINATTIKVTFADAVDAVTNANFTVSKGTLQSAVLDATKKIATLTVGGLTYNDTFTVTVTGVKAGAATVADYTNDAVRVPTMSELYTVTVTTDATDNTIKSDGASMTMLTATLTENATGLKVLSQDAQINFTTTLGSLSQPQVALTGGVATTQLRSISSATSVTAVVQATIASAPGATQYVGLSGNLLAHFTPDGSSTGSVTMVSPVSAGADQGDRFYVKFSGDVKAADYKAVVTAPGWAGAPYGVQYRGAAGGLKNLSILDVYNLTPDTLMFVLNTDVTGSVAPAIGDAAATDEEMMDTAFAHTTATHNFLRDNINHVINFPANITGLVTNSADITFMSSDVTKPFVYGVDATDNMNLVVRASESLAENLVETTADALGGAAAANQINSFFTIDGKVVRLNSTPTPANVTAAQAANEILVTELKVGKYTTSTDDTRNKVFIKLYKDFKLAAGTHGIQIANVGDWAGNTDAPANIVTTQTFNFTVAADTNVPTATVVAQSPEQFLITFSKPVDNVTGKTMTDALKIYTKEGYAAVPKALLVENSNSGANDYVVSSVDEYGGGNNLAAGATLSGVTRLLVEFNRDWSVKLNGGAVTKDNYWKSEITPLTFVIGSVESSTGVPMVESVQNVAMPYDGVSPTIAEATDLFVKSPNVAFRTTTATASGQAVYVLMSEPVQLVTAAAAQISNPITPNLQQFAAGAAYDAVTGIPVSTYRFINDANPDKVVLGTVAAAGLAQDDKSFVIIPATALDPGTWTLYIEQISDDHGNTSATISKQVTVPEAAPAAGTDTKVAWAAFDNNAGGGATDYDYLYVKFTKVMKAYVANGVDATTNYKFRGYDLPAGSQVFCGIDGITNDWDGVTIRMPIDAWDGLAGPSFTTNMSVASNFVAADDEALSGPFQFEITNIAGGSAGNKDGITASNLFEALYVNTTATGIAKGTTAGTAAILKATVTDAAAGLAGNGKIDTVTLVLSNNITTTAADKVYINGKEFVNTTAGLGATQVYVANAANEITGTASATLKVTSLSGAIMVNTAKVVDAAAPVIITATRTGANALTLGFSEGVYTDKPATAALIAGDIQVSPLGTCAELEVLAGITHTAGAATATATTTTAIVANTSSVGAQGAAQIYDAAGKAMGVIADGTATETLIK